MLLIVFSGCEKKNIPETDNEANNITETLTIEKYLSESGSLDNNGLLRAVSSGEAHTLVITKDGSLWAWGRNDDGRVGNGRTESCLNPVRIGVDNDWYSVSAGSRFSIALKLDGSLWAWGNNSVNELGDNTKINLHNPTRIGKDNDWVFISAGDFFTMAIKRDGSLWGWGGRERSVPIRLDKDNDWSFASAGCSHSLAIKTDGSLWVLGEPLGMSEEGWNFSLNFTAFTKVGTDTDWAIAAAGIDGSSIAIKTNGTLWAWGRILFELFGDNEYKIGPCQISDDTNWKFVSSPNYCNSMAVKTDGSLWAWGRLGSELYDDWGEPVTLMKFGNTLGRIWNNTIWSSVYTNEQYVVAVAPDGSLWACGTNNEGQLGDGSTVNKIVPVKINFNTSAVSKHHYPENNTVTLSLEAINARSFKLRIEGAVFTHDIQSIANHFLNISAQSDRRINMSNFDSNRDSDTEMTFTLYPGVPLYSSNMTIAFNRFDFALAIQADPLAIKKWKFQTDPAKSSITLQ